MTQQTTHAALRSPQSIGVSSPAFENGKPIPREYTGLGDDVNPELHLTGVPSDAQALAIVVDDPDAPGGTWTHWTVWDIEPNVRQIPRDFRVRAERGIEGQTGFGTAGYRGPMPPPGAPHRYHFRVFALSRRLALPENSPVADLWRALDAHASAWGELTGTFQRP